MTAVDITGQRFGRLVAVEPAGRNNGAITWKCMCDCGSVIAVRCALLRNGNTSSCGCVRREKLIERATKHGEAVGGFSPEYRCWKHMKERCTNPRCAHFRHYGGRGISVCARWLQSFPAFLEDMGRRPSSHHSLDRIDNDGNYEPGNCRWTTRDVQHRNKRRPSNTKLTEAQVREIRNARGSISALARRFGVDRKTLRSIRERSSWAHVQ